MDGTASPSVTDWMQGIGNIVQSIIAIFTAVASLWVAVSANKLSHAQIRPVLSLDVENGRRYAMVQLKNHGMGAATITKATYKLYGQGPRVDSQELFASKQERWWSLNRLFKMPQDQIVEARVRHSIRDDGGPAGNIGNRVYLLRHKQVHPPGYPDLTFQQLRDVLDPDGGNVEQYRVAGRVLQANGDIVLMRAAVREDTTSGTDPTPARSWLLLLQKMLNGAVVEVEYTDPRGRTIVFIDVISMPAPPEGA